ncbi:MAG: hypothetical protein GQ564_15860 [Bacteroidales bacterium]|nr:hypothetical protein [Bacteroidales bacterium]
MIGCEEDSVTTFINGTVKEYYSENTISNISLRIYDNTIDPKNPQLRQIKPYDTPSFVSQIAVDKLGDSDFKTELLESGREYLLVYNDYEKFSIYSNELFVGKNNSVDLKLKYYNTLKFKLENLNEYIDSVKLFISVDNSHFDQTEEIIDLLLDERFTIKNNLNTTVFSKSIPDCLHSITCGYFYKGE